MGEKTEVKKYNITYADPPWKYQAKMMNSSVTDHYSVLSLGELKSLPISQISASDCVLFIWVTLPKLNEVLEVISSWGFEYKTCAFAWVKTNRKSEGYFMGQGRWTRANVELCLLATKGRIARKSAGVRQLVVSPLREHSRKPDEVRDRIVELVGDLPRIELFARQVPEGWDVWGNEVESDIDLKPEPQIPEGFFRKI